MKKEGTPLEFPKEFIRTAHGKWRFLYTEICTYTFILKKGFTFEKTPSYPLLSWSLWMKNNNTKRIPHFFIFLFYLQLRGLCILPPGYRVSSTFSFRILLIASRERLVMFSMCGIKCRFFLCPLQVLCRAAMWVGARGVCFFFNFIFCTSLLWRDVVENVAQTQRAPGCRSLLHSRWRRDI